MAIEKVKEEPPGSQIAMPIVPAAPRRIGPPLKVAVLANMKKNVPLRTDAPPDDNVEYDREETVQAILDSLRSVGHKPFFLEADASLLDSVRKTKPEFCFNISEGLRGDARESHIPAILEMLGIPYSGSRILANAISLEKVIAKRIWRDRGLPTVPFQLFNDSEAPLRSTLRFPLFVKPVREGSGKGVAPTSIVQNEEELRREVRRIVGDYHQPALVESFLPGREFTVGVLGTGREATVLGTLEIVLLGAAEPDAYSYVNKEKCEELVEYRPVRADQDEEVRRAEQVVLDAWRALGCRDGGRLDVRSDAAGQPNFIECNPLAGLHPFHSDLPMIATAVGLPYQAMIGRIVDSACSRKK